MTYSLGVAYILWFLSGFGMAGLHRFYLGRIGSGLLYLFTGGVFIIGGIVDFFLMPTLVRDSNLRLRYHEVLYDRAARAAATPPRPARESLERVILRTAKGNSGVTAAGEIALAADIPVEQAQKALERLVAGGFAEMRVRGNGSIIYYFSEFDQAGNSAGDGV